MGAVLAEVLPLAASGLLRCSGACALDAAAVIVTLTQLLQISFLTCPCTCPVATDLLGEHSSVSDAGCCPGADAVLAPQHPSSLLVRAQLCWLSCQGAAPCSSQHSDLCLGFPDNNSTTFSKIAFNSKPK